MYQHAVMKVMPTAVTRATAVTGGPAGAQPGGDAAEMLVSYLPLT